MKNILMFILSSFLLVFFAFSCSPIKKSLSEKDLIYLNRVIDSMYIIDQNIRNGSTVIDSIYRVDRKSNGRFLFTKEKKIKLGDKYRLYEKSQDSIYSLMEKIDLSNTEQLIFLTEKYGFPSKERLKASKACAYLIFVHSPKKHHSKIEKIISLEYQKKRISEYEKEYIFWHLKGRKGMPPRLDTNGEVFFPK